MHSWHAFFNIALILLLNSHLTFCFADDAALELQSLYPNPQQLLQVASMGGGDGYRSVAYFVNWVSLPLQCGSSMSYTQ